MFSGRTEGDNVLGMFFKVTRNGKLLYRATRFGLLTSKFYG